MNKIYIFDVDGTLTPSRQKMTEKFYEFFRGWMSSNKFYLVTGSDLKKTKEQLPKYIIDRAEGIFTCCGNQFYVKDKLQYENKFELPKHIETYLKVILSNSPYPHRYGNHIENRGSMVNFSIVGRNCTQEQREEFFKYDNEVKERQRIADSIKKSAKGIDASIGGQISIDIYEEGKDKSQIVDIIEEKENKVDEWIFIGDRTMEGGNDYPLGHKIWKMSNGNTYQIDDGPEHTQAVLSSLTDGTQTMQNKIGTLGSFND
tara:strand:- start:242 stop:1018 length:777 start_codon:yes stop_codon:yes gene_type:complete